MSGAGYRFVDDVTSDVPFTAHAASPEELFGAAAEALLAVTLDDPRAVAATPHGLHVSRGAAGWEAEVTLDV